MTRHIKGASTSPFFDAEFAAQVSPRKKQAVYRPSRNRAKLAAVEALAQRWLEMSNKRGLMMYRSFGRELLDTLNNVQATEGGWDDWVIGTCVPCGTEERIRKVDTEEWRRRHDHTLQIYRV